MVSEKSTVIVVGKSLQIVLAVLRSLRSYSDTEVIVIGDEEADPLRWSGLFNQKRKISFDGSQDDVFIGTVNSLAKTRRAVLLPVDCPAVRMTQRMRAYLDIPIAPIPDTEILDTFDDKWRFYNFCAANGLRVPDTRYAEDKQAIDYEAMEKALGSPFIVKPANQAGSLGVQVIYSREDFEKKILRNGEYRFTSLIVQQYIDGEDIDASLLAFHGRTVGIAIQQVNGASVVFRSNPYLERAATEICEIGGYHGVMHIDARIHRGSGEVYLIEINPRFWASLTASVWCGLNFVAEALAQSRSGTDMLRLTDGVASTRHPLLHPACWPTLLNEQGARGRLLRASAFDPYSVWSLIKDLPMRSWRFSISKTYSQFQKHKYQKA